ncbi:MAG: hypothetical protein Q8Q14_13330 [Gemmatimonadales bacterium]|nr:hypothetical protein [Gemmatimonadales bacterium]
MSGFSAAVCDACGWEISGEDWEDLQLELYRHALRAHSTLIPLTYTVSLPGELYTAETWRLPRDTLALEQRRRLAEWDAWLDGQRPLVAAQAAAHIGAA